MWEDREYQVQAILSAWNDLREVKRSLWSIPTGGGKAYCLARLAEKFLSSDKSSRVLVVIDQSELVRQLRATFKSVLPNIKISVACKGVEKECDESAKIIIGTRQTIVNLDLSSWYFGLVMFDEAHELRLASEDRDDLGDGQFFSIINRIIGVNKDVMIHGCTATPYRLKDGWIFGNENRSGVAPLFPRLSYTITYADLFAQGNLVPPEFHKIESINRNNLEVSSTGDYLKRSSSIESCKHVKNALKAYRNILAWCSHTIAFCVDTEHCSALYDCFTHGGISAYIYNSKAIDNQGVLAEFREKGGVLITVDMATKGFDMPVLSGMLELRPTMSVAIYMQHIGRILRKYPGKDTAIIVDLVGNTSAHLVDNNLDRPIVKVKLELDIDSMEEMAEKKLKYCGNWPDCRAVMPITYRTCRECGYSFKGVTQFDGVELGEMAVFKHGQNEATGIKIINPCIEFCVKKIAGNKKILLVKFISLSGKSRMVNLFFPDSYGFKNGIVFNSKRIFRMLTGRPAPNNTDLASKIAPLTIKSATLSINNGHWNVTEIQST